MLGSLNFNVGPATFRDAGRLLRPRSRHNERLSLQRCETSLCRFNGYSLDGSHFPCRLQAFLDSL